MNNNKPTSLFLPLVLTLVLMTSFFVSCNNGSSTTSLDVDTFSDYATKGQSAYNSICT